MLVLVLVLPEEAWGRGCIVARPDGAVVDWKVVVLDDDAPGAERAGMVVADDVVGSVLAVLISG